MNKTQAKKYLSFIKNTNKRCLTCEQLSRHIGIYPEIIAEQLSFFEPMLAMDPEYDLKDLVPTIEEYVESLEAKKEKKQKTINIKKKTIQYKGVNDFIYQKMTIGGFFDRSLSLNDADLKILRKLVNEEIDLLKKNKKKNK